MEPVYVRFGAQLRSLRRQRKLSQADLARLVDPLGERLGRSSIANIESGRQRVALHHVLDFAKVLKVDPQELLPSEPRTAPDGPERISQLSEPEQAWFTEVVSGATGKRRPKKPHGAPA